MPNLNQVFLIGNLTRDPELRVTPKGTPICSFALAVNRRWRDEAGAEREEVTFVEVEAWAKPAELLAKYLTKGRPLMIQGRLKLDTWEDKNTLEKRSRLKVVCEQFQFLGSQRPDAAPAPAQTPAPAAAPSAAKENLDEDVPF